jgi:hypothetical protein
MPTKLEKREAQPKISIAKPTRDRDLGLWIDYDLLRKHQNHTTILHDASPAMNNRYLALADLALGNKTKKKSKAAAAASKK